MSCCDHDHDHGTFEGISDAYRRVLLVVIAINGAMFAVEMAAGFEAGSMALQADALDFLADSITYAVRLWAIGRSGVLRARVALAKGLSLAAMAVWVLGSTAWRVLIDGTPEALVMSSVGMLALAANVASVLLLLKWREGDANVRSVWLCSRNDAIGNIAVVAAGAGVWATGTGWPDLAVAAAMAGLFLTSALQIVRRGLGELRALRSA